MESAIIFYSKAKNMSATVVFCLFLSNIIRFFRGGYFTEKWQFQQLSGQMAEFG